MAKTEKSKAELYREERKERIASAAKKNAKKSKKNPKFRKVLGRVCGIVILVAVVGLAAFWALDETGVIARTQTAFKIGDDRISIAEYSYMYYMQYQNTANQAQQSESQYGYNIYGFDYKKSPEDQDSPYQDDDGNTLKWSEQIEKNTISYLQEFYALYNNAIADGYTLTEDEKADIEENIENMRQTASGAGTTNTSIPMSLNSYLKLSYGKGITEGFLRNLMKREMIVQRYSEDKQKSFTDSYTDEILDKEYKEDTTKYDAVDARLYKFDVETLTANEGETEAQLKARQDKENAKALEKANALLADVTDEKSFLAAVETVAHEEEETDETAEDAAPAEDAAAEDTTAEDAAEAEAEEEEEHDHDAQTRATGVSKDNLKSSVSEDAAKWAFAKGRKVGDKKAFTAADGSAYAMLIVKPAYAQECVDVRHILFMTVDSSSGEKLSAEEIAQKKAACDEVLAKWNALEDKTAEAFGELAAEYTEDTGSKETGGLYEAVTPGRMVDAFDSWIFDAKRQEGDVEVVESEYGYHIMYFVGNKSLSYRNTLRASHTQNDYSSWLEAELDKDSSNVYRNVPNMKRAYTRAYKLIDLTVENINRSLSSSSAQY